MKKKLFSIFAIVLVMVMAFTLFAACDDPNDPNDGGEKQPMQVEGKVFVYDRAEASVIPGKEAALEAYIAQGAPDLERVVAEGDETFADEKFVFYQGVVYMPDIPGALEFTQDGETVSIEGFEAGEETINSYQFRVQGEEFVIEFTAGIADEALFVVEYIFAYDREATAADIPQEETPGDESIEVEGKVFAFDRAEASVIPGKEAALEAYIAEINVPGIETIDDFLKFFETEQSEFYKDEEIVFYMGIAYGFDEMSEFTQNDDVVLTDIYPVSGIDSVQYRVRGNDFVIEYSTGLDEALMVAEYIFTYDRDAAETDVPAFDIDRNSYRLDSVELTELSQFGREELIRQYKLEFGDATDEEIIEFFEQMYVEMFSQDYAYVTATDGMMFLIDSSNEGYVDLQYVQDGASIEMSNPDALSGEPLFSATTRGNKLYVEMDMNLRDGARDVVFTLEYTLCDFIDPPVAAFEPTKPDLEPTVAINGEMTSSEMLQAALDNYYGADFALQKKNGSIETSIMKILVEQLVESVTIREGAADGDHSIYMRNQSSTMVDLSALLDLLLVRYWDEVDYIKSGSTEEVYRRTVGASDSKLFTIHDKNNALIDWWLGWTEGESYASPTKYNSLNHFVAQNAFDPTAIWMYDVSQQNITTMTDPVYHADRGTYTFDVALSAKAAADYAEWWRAVLAADDQNSEIEFTSVTLKFEIWDNGFLKSVTAQDHFYIKTKKGLINCKAVFETKTDFYFERDNLPSAFDDDAFDTSRLGEVKEYYDTVGGTEVPDNDAFDVNGKTFLFDHVEIEGGEKYEELTGESVEEALKFGNDEYYNVWLSFNDGVMSCNYDVFAGSYTQNGNTLTYTNESFQDQIATIEDGKLYMRLDDGSMDGVKIYMVMLLVDDGISADYSVAGKTFTIVSCDIPYVTPEQEQALMDEEGWTVEDYLARVEENFIGAELSFGNDGSVEAFGDVGTYVYRQEGGDLNLELPVAGISMSGEVRIDGEMTLVFSMNFGIRIHVIAQSSGAQS